MAYDFFGLGTSNTNVTLTIDGDNVELPDASYIRDADFMRDGMDLVLDGPQGTITIDGYFSAAEAPNLTASGGLILSPDLVNSFTRSEGQYAQNATLNDESPVGAVEEISGEATITRLDGSVEQISQGTPVYQGDVIETSPDGALNITFIDETSFAVSEEARLAIDEYVFDPSTEAGAQNFSVLKGVFVFTSGLIGRDDPDDVNIDTPSGSIGIRGTIIAGNVDTGEVTVVEGAIVVRDNFGNEVTLANQFETAKIDVSARDVIKIGQLPAQEVSERFESVSNVSPTLFSSIEDAAVEAQPDQPIHETQIDNQDQPREKFDANGSVDKDNDNDVDGTVDEVNTTGQKNAPEETAPETEEIIEEQTDAKPIINGELGTDPLGTRTLGTGSDPQTAEQQNNRIATAQAQESTLPGNAATTGAESQSSAINTDERQDPDSFNPAESNGSAASPFSVGGDTQFSTAPDAFFTIAAGQNFSYDFSSEFQSAPGGAALEFLINGVSNPTGAFTLPTSTAGAINIEVIAIDSATGAQSAPENFTLNVIAPNAAGAASTMISGLGPFLDAQNGGVFLDTTNATDNLMLGFSSPTLNTQIFTGGGNDNINILMGNDNLINLGDGNNTVSINDNASNIDNVIIGGANTDDVTLSNIQNNVFTLSGDDTISINFTGTNAQSGLSAAGNDIILDGGEDTRDINTTDPSGLGDTLQLLGSAAGDADLDFTAVDDGYIRGIERLDLNNANTTTITLDISDVFEMTDFRNTLIIRADDDTINLNGFTQTQDNVARDDGDGTRSFDTYEGTFNGNDVTLLIEDTGAVVNA